MSLWGGGAVLGEASERESGPRAGSAGLGDSYFPGSGNGGYDVQHYDIELAVQMEDGSIEATTTIRALATHALSSFNLDFDNLEITALEVNGAAASFEWDARELTVTPNKPLENGAEFETVVRYRGIPNANADLSSTSSPGVGWFHRPSGIYVASECTGSPSWFPCNDHPSDRATFRYRVTVAKPFVVVANGILQSETDNGSTRTFDWNCVDTLSPYLATMNIAEFEVRHEEGPGGLPMWTSFTKGTSERELVAYSRQAEMVEFFESVFGPYPFHSLGAIVTPVQIGGALETTTAPIYGKGMTERVVAHEIAHQWFGDSVAIGDWSELWLNEGFATYAAILWDEYSQGFDVAERQVKNIYTMLRQLEVGPPPSPGVDHMFGAAAYKRGAWVLHALRMEVEDEFFFEILQTWAQDHSDKPVRTADFIKVCEDVSGADLGEFFDAHLFAPVIPEVADL